MLVRVFRNRVLAPLAAARIRAGTALAGGTAFEYWGRLSDRVNQAPIGDRWLARGAAQFEFLKRIGLRPEHRFLDYGCAVLATAAHVIPYLRPGNYVGVDVGGAIMAAGARRIAERGIDRRRYHLLRASEPALPELEGFRFDFVFAASVFQYLNRHDFEIVMRRLHGLLDPGALFATTYSVPAQLAALRHKGMRFYGVDDYARFFRPHRLFAPHETWGSHVALLSLAQPVQLDDAGDRAARRHELHAVDGSSRVS